MYILQLPMQFEENILSFSVYFVSKKILLQIILKLFLLLNFIAYS